MKAAIIGIGVLAVLVAAWVFLTRGPAGLSVAERAALYAEPLEIPDGPLATYHLGHSLVGRDMPAMLAQLAGHNHASQLGWGASLKAHWDPDEPINGFEAENAHPNYHDAKEALASGDYDVLVLTEMVEIEAAIEYFDAPNFLRNWALAGWQGNPDQRIYLYESWHDLEDAKGWLARLDTDPEIYWEGTLIARALAGGDAPHPIYVIPAGRIFADVVRQIEAGDGVDGITSREDFFARMPDGSLDTIHVNDLGTYLVAIAHYATIYHKNPVGLPRQLTKVDGTAAIAPGPELAQLIQETAWRVVTSLPQTGVASGTD